MEIEVKEEQFVESVQYIPEQFESAQDALPESFAPEIEDERLKKESPVEQPTETGEKSEESEKKEEKTDDAPEIDKETIAKELEEIREKLKKAEARSGYWQRQAEKKVEVEQPKTEEVPLKKPVYEEYTNDQDYLEALTDYKVELKLREQDAIREKQKQAVDAQSMQSWTSETIAEGITLFDDFHDIVTDPIVPITDQILKAVRNSNVKDSTHAEVLYYLGKNIRETAKISRLTPEAIGREIEGIAQKIAGDKAKVESPEPQKPKPKQVTSAPPPVAPVKSAVGVQVTKDPAKMTNEEYRSWRASQPKRR